MIKLYYIPDSIQYTWWLKCKDREDCKCKLAHCDWQIWSWRNKQQWRKDAAVLCDKRLDHC